MPAQFVAQAVTQTQGTTCAAKVPVANVGYMLIAQVQLEDQSGDPLTLTPPAGWTYLHGNAYTAWYYHVVAAGDPTTVDWNTPILVD